MEMGSGLALPSPDMATQDLTPKSHKTKNDKPNTGHEINEALFREGDGKHPGYGRSSVAASTCAGCPLE
jgi:hypothetical protein